MLTSYEPYKPFERKLNEDAEKAKTKGDEEMDTKAQHIT
jgi:hypothetical protein